MKKLNCAFNFTRFYDRFRWYTRVIFFSFSSCFGEQEGKLEIVKEIKSTRYSKTKLEIVTFEWQK